MASTLVSLYFRRSQHGHTIKTNCKIFQTLDPDPEMC